MRNGLCASSVASPFSGLSGMLATLLRVSPFDVSFRWNWRYGITWFAFGLLCLYLYALSAL